MDHFARHPSATFEGYYSKFRLPSRASIALIVSTNHTAYHELQSLLAKSHTTPWRRKRRNAKNPYMISFTYVSAEGTKWWQREFFPDELLTRTVDYPSGIKGFNMIWDKGEFTWIPASASPQGIDVVSWYLNTPELRFKAYTLGPTATSSPAQRMTGGRTPWNPSRGNSTPAGWMARLPLPIQWHVHSLDSACEFRLWFSQNPSSDLDIIKVPSGDHEGVARVHIEKNWAHSFPTAYIWIQARDGPRGVCIAGGTLWGGAEAYLISYHSPAGHVSFVPPLSAKFGRLSFGLSTRISWEERSIVIDVKGWRTRVRVSAVAPPDTFFTLGAPLSYGHESDYTAQSFAADTQVEVFRRSFWAWLIPWKSGGSWKRTEQESFKSASLEFGGSHYKSHTL